MAQGRMLQKRISRSRKIPRLVAAANDRVGPGHGFAAALLYTWCLAHLDIEGRIHGDPHIIKGEVFPLLDPTAKDVDRYLLLMAEIGLIRYYELAGERFIAYPDFKDKQPHLRQDRESPSEIPPPGDSTPGVLPEASRQTPAQEKRREEKLREENTASPSARLDFDFEAVYSAYPRKEGKKRGLEKCKAQIKTPERLAQLVQAVKNYAAAGYEPRFQKHFDSFMSCWEDYAGDWRPPAKGPEAYEPPYYKPLTMVFE